MLIISIKSTHLVPKRGLFHSHSGARSSRGETGKTRVCRLLQLRSGFCESAALSWFRGERRFRVPSVVYPGRIGAKVGGLAAGGILTVSPPCAQCDRHPQPSLPPVSPPSLFLPLASSPFQARTRPISCPGKMCCSHVNTASFRGNCRTLRRTDAIVTTLRGCE